METTASTTTLTCICTACGGKSVTADTAAVAEFTTPKARREITHTLVQYGHGTSPLSAIMRGRYGVVAA